MQEYRENVEAAGFGALMGLFSYWLSLFPAIPAWLSHGLVTVLASAGAIVLNHFLQRELRRRWPDRNRKRGDTNE